MKNFELKAELRDPNLARLICQKIGASKVIKLRQTDVYYNVARGRLKKRTSVAVDRAVGSPEPIEYIFYERENRTDARFLNIIFIRTLKYKNDSGKHLFRFG